MTLAESQIAGVREDVRALSGTVSEVLDRVARHDVRFDAHDVRFDSIDEALRQVLALLMRRS